MASDFPANVTTHGFARTKTSTEMPVTGAQATSRTDIYGSVVDNRWRVFMKDCMTIQFNFASLMDIALRAGRGIVSPDRP